MVGRWRPPEMINEPQKHRQRWLSPNNRMSNDGNVCPKNIGIVSLRNPHKKIDHRSSLPLLHPYVYISQISATYDILINSLLKKKTFVKILN